MIKNVSTFLFFLAAIALFWFWTRPYLNEIDGLKVNQSLLQKALEDSKELQKVRDVLLEKYNSITTDDLSRLSKIVPSDSETTKILVQLENAAGKAGVTVKNLNSSVNQSTPQPPSQLASSTPAPGISTLDIRISASYESMKSFLDELQTSLRVIDIDGLNFTAADKNFYEITIKALTYFKK